MTLRTLPGATLLPALALTLGAFTLISSPAAAEDCRQVHDVKITDRFTPKEITIQAGDCVRFTNRHNIEHSAVAVSRLFASGQLMPGGAALIRFPEPGTVVPYICGIHPPMGGGGKIVVLPPE